MEGGGAREREVGEEWGLVGGCYSAISCMLTRK